MPAEADILAARPAGAPLEAIAKELDADRYRPGGLCGDDGKVAVDIQG